MVEINIPERILNLKVSEEELKQRKAVFLPPKKEVTGYLARVPAFRPLRKYGWNIGLSSQWLFNIFVFGGSHPSSF